MVRDHGRCTAGCLRTESGKSKHELPRTGRTTESMRGAMSHRSILDHRWSATVMGSARAHAVVRALAEYAYGLVVPDLTRPAWFQPALGDVDNFPNRMRALELILDQPGSLLWESPPRPKIGDKLSASQKDLQHAIGCSTEILCTKFSEDHVAVQALAATAMAWGAYMPPILQVAALKAAEVDGLAAGGNAERQRCMQELAELVRSYKPGNIAVVSGEGR